MSKKPPLTFNKTRTGLVPADSYTAKCFDDVALGAEFRAVPMTKRSNRQNGLYWSVLQEVVDATGKWATPYYLHDALKMDIGFRVCIERMDGKKHWIADSTAYEKMSPEDFKEYFDTAMARLSEVVGYDVLKTYYEMTGQVA